jgi:hypothetical protein
VCFFLFLDNSLTKRSYRKKRVQGDAIQCPTPDFLNGVDVIFKQDYDFVEVIRPQQASSQASQIAVSQSSERNEVDDDVGDPELQRLLRL